MMKAFVPYSNLQTFQSWSAGQGFCIAGIGKWLAQWSLSGRVVIWKNSSESLAIVAFAEDADAVACTLKFSEYAQ